jgi:hypothetical protein
MITKVIVTTDKDGTNYKIVVEGFPVVENERIVGTVTYSNMGHVPIGYMANWTIHSFITANWDIEYFGTELNLTIKLIL